MKDKERLKQMIDLKLDGYTYQVIGDSFGISRQRVQQLLEPPTLIRKTVYKRAGGRCENCGILVGVSGHLHHRNNGDIDFQDIDNLELLCPSCHRLTHAFDNPNSTPLVLKNIVQGDSIVVAVRVPRESIGPSTVRGIRISNKDYERIMERAARKGWTFNRWMNYAIKEGLRSHKSKGGLTDGNN